MTKGILLKIGLKASPQDPCFLSDILDKTTSRKTISEDQSQLQVGLYVDDLLLYSSDTAHEVPFQTLLQEHIQVDVLGDVDYFLGSAFNWLQHKDGNISVHLCQSEFKEFTAHWFSVQSENKVTNITPYRSSFPIGSIPPVDPLDPDLPCQR